MHDTLAPWPMADRSSTTRQFQEFLYSRSKVFTICRYIESSLLGNIYHDPSHFSHMLQYSTRLTTEEGRSFMNQRLNKAPLNLEARDISSLVDINSELPTVLHRVKNCLPWKCFRRSSSNSRTVRDSGHTCENICKTNSLFLFCYCKIILPIA